MRVLDVGAQSRRLSRKDVGSRPRVRTAPGGRRRKRHARVVRARAETGGAPHHDDTPIGKEYRCGVCVTATEVTKKTSSG